MYTSGDHTNSCTTAWIFLYSSYTTEGSGAEARILAPWQVRDYLTLLRAYPRLNPSLGVIQA